MNYFMVFWRLAGESDPHSLFTLNEADANWLEASLKNLPDVAGVLRMEVKGYEPKQSAWQSLWNTQKKPDGPVN